MNKKEAILVINNVLSEGRNALSEYESKQLLAAYGIPVTREILVEKRSELLKAIREIGFPLVLKGCSAAIAHKTEKGLIRIDLRNKKEVLQAFDEIQAGMNDDRGAVLVQEMIKGQRELVLGMTRDDQFGPCIMFGLGGIFTEILHDVSFRRAPLTKNDAYSLMQEIRGHKIISAVRGMEAADKETLADMLIALGLIGTEIGEIREIDLNPVIISRGKPIVVDALIILK
ncbi:MAG: succinyl-CoA synthetase subunit beta [Smithella sp. PtaU1.Bin162]|nr:MAG: succinyl-CoA synthetase subunit beta [Smithella sp. PtaU1.Bin162]